MNSNSDARSHYFGRDLEAMSFARNYNKWIVEEFSPYLGDTLAEVGAGTGNLSRLWSETGIKRLIAFEPSDNMYPLLVDNLRGTGKAEAVNAFFSDEYRNYDGFFDAIAYVNVLEHVENDLAELRCVHRALKDDGHLLIFVPALTILYSELDKRLGHFRRYHKQALSRLVTDAGFTIVKIKYFDLAGIVPWFLAFVLLKRIITGGNVSLYDKLVVPATRAIEEIVTPPVGKNLLLVARKA